MGRGDSQNIEHFGTAILPDRERSSFSNGLLNSEKSYVEIRSTTFRQATTGRSVSVVCLIPATPSGVAMFRAARRAAQAEVGEKGTLGLEESVSSTETQRLVSALLGRLAPKETSIEGVGARGALSGFDSGPSTTRSMSTQNQLATVYVYAIGGAFAVNLSGLVNFADGELDQIKVHASLGPDFCYHLEQATIAANEAIADKAQQMGQLNEAWASVDSALDAASCECTIGATALPTDCFDLWIEPASIAGLLGDGRSVDSLARISKSRAQIYFDPSDASKTRVFVNSTKRQSGTLVIESAPDPSNTVTSTMVGDTLVIQWHLVNSACRDVLTMPCVAISGSARFRRDSFGSVWYDVERDAFPSLGYFRRSSSSCTFNTVFVRAPRRLPFNLDFLNLLPIAPNEIIKNDEGVPNSCDDES
jgi:hypothetical protein